MCSPSRRRPSFPTAGAAVLLGALALSCQAINDPGEFVIFGLSPDGGAEPAPGEPPPEEPPRECRAEPPEQRCSGDVPERVRSEAVVVLQATLPTPVGAQEQPAPASERQDHGLAAETAAGFDQRVLDEQGSKISQVVARTERLEARIGPWAATWESMRYAAGWSSGCTSRARSPMTCRIRRTSTPTSCSRRCSDSGRGAGLMVARS